MAAIRRVVIDVLKPHDPSMLTFTDRLADLDCVDGVTASLIELDQEVQNAKFTVEGQALDFDSIQTTVEEIGGSVHSVDQVSCGEHVVTDQATPQDR